MIGHSTAMTYSENTEFTAVAPYYDELMTGVPYDDWVRYIERLLAGRHASPRQVLDLACGTGNVSEIMAERSYHVVGVDIAADMIKQAKRKAERKLMNIEYHVQDAVTLDLPATSFDLCISLFDSLNYITNPSDLAKAIQRVYAHLRPGGLFIFDVNAEYALKNGFFDQSNDYSAERLRYVWRSEYDAATRICTVAMRFFLRGKDGVDKEFRETHVQFAYTEAELRSMLSDAGFIAVDTYHAYTMKPVRKTTDRIYFVAEKPVI